MTSLLEVENLTVKIPIDGSLFPVVDHLSFSIKPGKIVALVGESGCGKTLAALSLLRLHPFEISGKVGFGGENLLTINDSSLREIRGNKISMVFQDPSNTLNPVATIGSNCLKSFLNIQTLMSFKQKKKSSPSFMKWGLRTHPRC